MVDLLEYLSPLRDGLAPEDRVDRAMGASQADLVVVSPRYGVIALIAVADEIESGAEQRLSAAIAYYRDGLGEIGRRRVTGLFFAPTLTAEEIPARARRLCINSDNLADRSWADVLLGESGEGFTPKESAEATDFVFPGATVVLTRRFEDSAAPANDALRIKLDEQQREIAASPEQPLLHILGGAGSGKSVVLTARAQWLASSHPNWRVLVLCYNEALRVALDDQLSHLPTVTVQTFRSAARSTGVSIKEYGDDAAAANDAAISAATDRLHAFDKWDAVLIDEGQDFSLSWLNLVWSMTRADRGGLTVTSDPSQGLYQLAGNGAIPDFFASHPDAHGSVVKLQGSYRTTRQILEAAVHASGARHEGAHRSPDGSNVQLIWAPSLQDQGACIASEIANLIENGTEPSDIAILYTSRYVLQNNPFKNFLTAELDELDVPFVVLAKQAKVLARAGDAVTITTVHSAKGKDFSAVFVIGVEALKTGAEPTASSQRSRVPTREVVFSRTAYVACTRARNVLMLTYTKPNSVIERLKGLATVDQWDWPADYSTGR